VNIYNAEQKRQHFGMIQNAYIRVVDDANNKELCKYNLSEGYDKMTALTVGELSRDGSGWKFGAIGDASTESSLQSITKRYGR